MCSNIPPYIKALETVLYMGPEISLLSLVYFKRTMSEFHMFGSEALITLFLIPLPQTSPTCAGSSRSPQQCKEDLSTWRRGHASMAGSSRTGLNCSL